MYDAKKMLTNGLVWSWCLLVMFHYCAEAIERPNTSSERERNSMPIKLVDDDAAAAHLQLSESNSKEQLKRAWNTLRPNIGWGKRAWHNLQNTGWGKRYALLDDDDNDDNNNNNNDNKRQWQKFQGAWGKRWPSIMDNEWWSLADNSETSPPIQQQQYEYYEDGQNVNGHGDDDHDDDRDDDNTESAAAEKRTWRSLNAPWGKRATHDWGSFRGSWGKRDPAWNNLKGLWGKRSIQESRLTS